MTNKEAKEKAIREAWEPYWSNKECPRLTKRQKQIALKNNGWVEWFGPDDDNLEFRSKDYCSRPRILKNIETNNGWTRIELDGSNLPDESGADGDRFKVGSLKDDGRFDIIETPGSAKWLRWIILKSDYFKATHFKPIGQEKPPIW